MSCNNESLAIWERSGTLANRFWTSGRLDFPIYDMHGHMGSHYAIYFKRCEPDAVAEHLRRIGVSKLVFSHHHALWGSLRNSQVVEICRRYPDLFRMYIAINPHYPDHIREDLAQVDKWAPFVAGIKMLASYHEVKASDPAYEYALKFCDERNMLVLNHTWGSSPCCNGVEMLTIARRYSHAVFLMGHCIYGDWPMAERVVKETPGNVYLELTCIPGENGVVERLTAAVGSERLLYGTDMPWFDEYQAVGGILSAKITENDMRNILSRNAEKLLGERNLL